jgi:hypothetical protein
MIFLMSLEELWRLLKCYFPVFAAANFSQLFALAIGIPMMFDRYFGALPVNVNLKYTFFYYRLRRSYCSLQLHGRPWLSRLDMDPCHLDALVLAGRFTHHRIWAPQSTLCIRHSVPAAGAITAQQQTPPRSPQRMGKTAPKTPAHQ